MQSSVDMYVLLFVLAWIAWWFCYYDDNHTITEIQMTNDFFEKTIRLMIRYMINLLRSREKYVVAK
jgi:hypothetical protein